MEDWALAREDAHVLKDIVFASLLDDHRLRVRYEDGVEGIVDLGSLISFRGVFAPLKDPAYFSQVRVDPELGTVSWPNGADLDPDVLYGRLVPNSDELVSR
jgi:hypothetical protein